MPATNPARILPTDLSYPPHLGGITGDSDLIRLGRTTHEMFAPAWRDRTSDDDPGAPFSNDTEKLVVGAEEPAEEWDDTTRFGAYDAQRLRELKESEVYANGVVHLCLVPRT